MNNLGKVSDSVTIIKAGQIGRHYWQDIWRYRGLFFVLSWRDISVRYKQTVIGIAWAVIRPVLTMVVFTVIFNKVAKLQADGSAPYAIMVYAAMLPWQFFATALTESSNSLVGNAQLISKVYFPRMIIPASTVVASLIDFLISFGILVVLMICFGFLPSWQIVFLPIFLIIACGAALGIGLFFSALNVKFRDFRHIVFFVVQFGLYISPVGFSSNVVPDKYRLLYSLNPTVGVIDGFRWAILGGESTLYWPGLLVSVAVTLLCFVGGVVFFRNMERSFADII